MPCFFSNFQEGRLWGLGAMGRNNQYRLFFLLFFLAFTANVSAQLVGSFRITSFAGDSITEGCGPLIVTLVDSSKINGNPVPFTSIATGGAYNSHTWHMGNPPSNNVFTIYRPSFVYSSPGTYNIRLIVTHNGIVYDTIIKQVTVRPQPVVGFYADPLLGCSPYTVTVYDTSSNTTNCTWSMGDGTVYTNQCTITHTYNQVPGNTANCFNITLIGTNQFGCQSSLTKNNYVCITPRPRARFTVDNSILCDSPFVANFIDTSTSVNGLAYFWRFNHPSNNPSSTQQNPSHTYPPGTNTYNVSLIIRDTICNTRDTVIKTGYISTSNVRADFSVDTTIVCQGNSARFTANITGTYTSVLWDFGDGTTSTQLNPTHVFANAGTWDVTLSVFAANGCRHDTTYTAFITVRPQPTAAFTYSPNPANSCQAPFTVNFTDQSTGATTWNWFFQHPSTIQTTNQQNPSYTYNNPGTYSVRLRVTNQFGCVNTIIQNNIVTIAPTVVNFSMDETGGCAPLVTTFTDASTSPANNPIIGWTWNFDDPTSGANNSSNLQNPTHTYDNVGTYRPCLTIVTQSGCTGTRCLDVSVGNPPTASFSLNPSTVCVDVPISFVNTSTGTITDYQWIFGAPAGQTSGLQNPPNFAFDEPGTYDIQLTVGQNGCVDDTTITVEVIPPKADFDFTVSCSNPSTVIFTDESIGADTWSWTFGEPSSGGANSSTLQNPTHTYLSSGTYRVRLTVTNNATGCSHMYEQDIAVSILQARFTANTYTGCAPLTVNFTGTSTGTGITRVWDFGDPASGALNTSTALSPSHVYNAPGRYTVRLIVTDVYGCRDTMIQVDTINVSNVSALFSGNPLNGCIPSNSSSFPTLAFTDQSTTSPGTTINSWNWIFPGAGTSTQQNPTPQYNTPGTFDVTLTVTNSAGCSSTYTEPSYVRIRQITANFNVPFGLYCANQPIQFNNTTTGAPTGVTYFWDFGDPNATDDTSRLANPTHAYSDTGSYTVTLIVTYAPFQCTDTIVIPNAVRVDIPELRFVANDTFRYCPPHLVNFANFTNLDTAQVRRVRWDFGDGNFSSLLQPSHIYNRAGLFTVCLWVEFINGCQDSICYPDYINIGGTVGRITAAPDSGCSPVTICFDANSDSSATNHIWFFGDNSPWVSGEDTICHTYTEAGLYEPAVLLIDNQVPACQYILVYDDTLVIDSVIAGFITDADTFCQNVPIQFTDSSFTLSGNDIVAWEWDFGDSTAIDTTQNPLHTFQNTGLLTVTLTAYSSLGCFASISHDIFVWSSPTAAFDVSDTIGCVNLLVTFTEQSTPGDAPISTWFWDFGVANATNDTSILQNPPDYFYADTGRYIPTLIVTDDNGCRDTAQHTINIYPNPNGLANPDTVSICLFDTLQLLGDTSYVSYEWTPGIWLSDSTIAQPYTVPLDTIDYILITTDQYGCFTIDSIHIIVNPLPTLTVSPYPDTAICEGQSVQLSAVGSGIAYVWSPAAGLDNPNSANPLATPAQTTTYQVYTVDGNGCNITDTVRVVVNRFFTNYLTERVCLGDRTDFVDQSFTSDLSIATWQWDFGDTNTTADVSSVRSPNYIYPDSGNYTVTLILTDIIGCTDTLQQIARVDHPAEPAAGPDTIICFGDAIQLTASGGDTIFWAPAVDIDNANSFTPIVSPQVTTTYVANITYGVCPFDTAKVVVEVNPTPLLEINSTFNILKGDSVVLETATGIYDTIFWEPATWLDCTDCPSPQSKPDSTIIYTVTVIDSLGCINTKEVLVRVEVKCSEDQIFVGNGFTPNGDGVNDIAYARLHGLKGLIMYRIFDRWGDLVFETNNAYEGWDGKNSKGEQLNSGVYVYIVEAECFSGQKLTKTGNVAIIK